jgi:hypothetical protein
MEEGDFSIRRDKGDRLPIGIVAEERPSDTIPTIQIGPDYCVFLDLDEPDIIIFKNGNIFICAENEDPKTVIKALR